MNQKQKFFIHLNEFLFYVKRLFFLFSNDGYGISPPQYAKSEGALPFVILILFLISKLTVEWRTPYPVCKYDDQRTDIFQDMMLPPLRQTAVPYGCGTYSHFRY